MKPSRGRYSQLGANGQEGAKFHGRGMGHSGIPDRKTEQLGKMVGPFFQWYLYTTAMVLKLEGASESPKGLVKTQISDPIPRVSESGSR